MFDAATCSLLAPRVKGPPLALPFKKIALAESRIQEIAFVNAHKAPELLATFNIAYLELKQHLVNLEFVLHEAKKAANQRAAIVLLDEVPKILRERGLDTARSPGGSADQRKAILDSDKAYEEASDRVAQVEAIISLLKGKAEAVEMAYTSVKKILGGETNWHDLNQNRNLSAGAPVPLGATGTTTDPHSPRGQFGAAE